MIYRRLGRSGLQVGALSLGTWATFGETLDRDTARETLAAAFANGVNLFDSAEIYANGGAESCLGELIEELGWKREHFVVSTKVMWGTGKKVPNGWGLSRKHVMEGCHASLKRLRLDHIDLYFCHRPDPLTPLEETVQAMGDLCRQGKILYWGTSEWPVALIREARDIAAARGLPLPVVEQPQYNLLERKNVEQNLSPLCAEFGMGLTTWSPLAYGLLAGRYDDGDRSGRLWRDGYDWLRKLALGEDPQIWFDRLGRFGRVCAEIGAPPSSVALAWVLSNEFVSSAIMGVSSVRQLEVNLESLGLLKDVESVKPLLLEIFSGDRDSRTEQE